VYCRVERILKRHPVQWVAREFGECKLRKTNVSKLSTILNRWSHIGRDYKLVRMAAEQRDALEHIQ